MILTPEQIAKGWRLHDGSDVCPIKDGRTVFEFMILDQLAPDGVHCTGASFFIWSTIIAYRIIEAHGADAEPARPTPFPADYSELVWNDDGWSQTIIVDGKRPEWLRDDDGISAIIRSDGYSGHWNESWQWELAIRVRRREPKRETVTEHVEIAGRNVVVEYDLIDGEPDLTTLKIRGDA